MFIKFEVLLLQKLYFKCQQILRLNDKVILLVIISVVIIANKSFSQSPYYFKTIETLKSEKSKATSSGNEAKSNEIAKEIELRNSEQKEIELLNIELNKKIEVEDYLEAETIKQKITELKSKQSKAEEINYCCLNWERLLMQPFPILFCLFMNFHIYFYQLPYQRQFFNACQPRYSGILHIGSTAWQIYPNLIA